MYTARNMCAGIAIAYWVACIISSPLLHAANLSGQWQLEGEELHRFEHQKWAEYDNGNIIDTMEEDFVGVVDQPHFESEGYAVHSDGTIEGYFKRKRVCGEEFDYGFTGTISEDNHVSLLIIYPGGSEKCNLYGATWYLSYTDMISYYDGVYDPLKGTITGTYTSSQERVYTECWDYDPWFGYDHYSVESTHIVTSGTFTIRICCSCSDAKQYNINFHIADRNTPPGRIGDPIEAESGKKIELWWSGSYYELLYWRPGGPQGLCLGLCVFDNGCNEISFYAQNLNNNNKPDCFTSIHWINKDFGSDDNNDGYLDVIEHSYVTCLCQDKYTRVDKKFYYACGPPIISEPGSICKTICNPPYGDLWDEEYKSVDTPLGPETEALFDELLRGHEGAEPDNILMSCSPFGLSDMDLDGDCDTDDCRIMNAALGKRWEQAGYFPLVDINADGFLTSLDVELMLEPREPDLNGDGVVNFIDLAIFAAQWSPNTRSDWCGMADFNKSGAVDLADLTTLAEHWLEGGQIERWAEAHPTH